MFFFHWEIVRYNNDDNTKDWVKWDKEIQQSNAIHSSW